MATSAERRSSGLLRVPFVQRCQLEFDGGGLGSAFIVNISVIGAYFAVDDLPAMPPLNVGVVCRFAVPGTETPLVLRGVVAWLNLRQQHPVHSLPPGFGVKFRSVEAPQARRIEGIVAEYVARHPGFH